MTSPLHCFLAFLRAGVLAGLVIGAAWNQAGAAAARQTLSLDGTWQVAEGGMETAPQAFDHMAPVPGLLDLARPAFPEVGLKSSRREAFWYRTTFRVAGPLGPVAQIKVHKAMFGTRVFLNGKLLGDHQPCFTPAYFDARPALQQGENELVIRVGAFRDAVPKPVPSGWDYEKYKFSPGIFDSVELIQSGLPHIERVQVAPEPEKKAVTVHAWVRPGEGAAGARLRFLVREAKSRILVGQGEGHVAGLRGTGVSPVRLGQDAQATQSRPAPNEAELQSASGRLHCEVSIPIREARLWSPEDPFLYELEARSEGDAVATRFGLRSFRLDPATGRAILNGRPYYMRGSNVTLYRFFEDAECGDKPWREQWVRRLHEAFRDMRWNCLRYCIGFPPERWYDIADEEGFLIQDEFPIWNMDPKAGDFDADELAGEYAEWMQERWNHPCVVVWDACNETRSPETGKAIQKVRGLDFSHRPWDNGWSPAQDPADVFESHPYHFYNPNYKLANLAHESGNPTGNVIPNRGHNPIIVNEYGWLWLNRDGTPTTLTKDLYRNLLGTNSTTAQRRHLYARYLAAETEFWRAHRACAAVMHFCALGYSRPGDQPRPQGGATSDHWADVERLTWEPEFYTYVRDAFAPVGIMIDAWAEDYPAGSTQQFPVVVINDLYEDWKGAVRFQLLKEGRVVKMQTQPCEAPALGERKLSFSLEIPTESAAYQLVAELAPLKPGGEAAQRAVRSLRDFAVASEAELRARRGLAFGKPVRASSSLARDGASEPEAVVDGRGDTRWSSEFSDPQWIAIDLEQPQRISRVELDWEAAYARAYTLDVSLDGETWKEVYRTEQGRGGAEKVAFAPVEARWVRLTGTRRATEFGYSLWEFRVYP